MDPLIADALRKSAWSSMCSSAAGHARHMGALCLPEFRNLLERVAQSLARLPTPEMQPELQTRMKQAAESGFLVQNISHANAMSRLCPRARQALLVEAEQLASLELPKTEEGSAALRAQCSAFGIRVQSLCDLYCGKRPEPRRPHPPTPPLRSQAGP